MSQLRINGALTTGLPVTAWAAKLVRRNARYTKSTFEDLPSAVFWLRMAIAVLCGVVSGLAPLTGWSGFVVFGAAALGAVMLLLGPTWLDVDYDEWGFQELAGEGLMPSFGIFLVRYRREGRKVSSNHRATRPFAFPHSSCGQHCSRLSTRSVTGLSLAFVRRLGPACQSTRPAALVSRACPRLL